MRRIGLGRGEVRRKKRKRWWTDGCGLEVDGGQLAAGRLRKLCHHTGQGPILSLQPLLNLPQGLNLLYLGEVLQGGWGDNNHNRGEKRNGGGRREREWQKRKKERNVFEETNQGRKD